MDSDPNAAIRMFNACPACGRQYDVSHLDAGSRVRCACGVLFDVEFRTPRSPRALKCSNCGGLLVRDAQACGYCGAEITLEERRLSAVCPGCFARMAADAKYCMECGIAIEAQALMALPEDAQCPRCEGSMRARAVGSANVSECARCGGLWLTEEDFRRVCEHSDEQELASRALTLSEPSRRAASEVKVRYLPCVVCKDLMVRRNYSGRSGIIIDVCRNHGVWLDHAELEGILAFIRSGGLDRARELQLERLKEREARAREAQRSVSRDLVIGESLRPVHRGTTLADWVLWAVDGIFQ